MRADAEASSGEHEATLQEHVGQILKLAAPAVLGMAASNIMALVETTFASRLGAAALGGVGIGVVLHWLSAAGFLGLAAAVQAVSARRVGAGAGRGPAHALVGALGVVLFVAVPLAVTIRALAPRILHALSTDDAVVAAGLEYLGTRMIGLPFFAANLAFRGMWSGVGRTSVYLVTNVIINALHIAFGWMLIFGHLGAPRLGATGAGLAGTLSVASGTLLYVVISAPRLRHADLAGARAELPTLARLSVPAGGEAVLLFAGFAVFYAIAARVGTVELAASHALAHLMLAGAQLADGFGIAAATLVGQSIGRRRPAVAARFARMTAALAASACAAASLGLAAGSGRWLSILVHEPAAVAVASVPLLFLAAVLPFDAAGIVLARALVGAGAVRIVAAVSIGLQWGLFLPVIALAVGLHGGMTTLWLGMTLWRLCFFGLMVAAFRLSPWARTQV
jgi:putative MATE family efflux protein